MGSIVGLLGSIGSPDLAGKFRVSGFLKTCSDTLLLCVTGTVLTRACFHLTWAAVLRGKADALALDVLVAQT